MYHIWDYDEKELKKSEWGRKLILERMINYGPGKKKISVSMVKKYWDELDIYPNQRALMSLLIWGKTDHPSKKDGKKYFIL